MRLFGNVPSTASELEPATQAPAPPQHPMSTITASAARLTGATLAKRQWSISASSRGGNWQEDAWDMLDLVGEQRFLANTLASRLSQARLYVGRIPADTTTDEPEPVEDETINDVLEAIGGSMTGRAQLLKRLSVNMFVAGEGWLVGVPTALLPEEYRLREMRPGFAEGDLFLEDMEWRMVSTSEISSDGSGRVTVQIDEGVDVVTSPDNLYLIRVWSPHPRRSWEADSPTRSSLPVLRELVGLTMHISAQVDSRLAGAGLLLVPSSAAESIKAAAGLESDSADDPITDALIDAMMTPISDRSSASATVPLVMTVPDETTEMFKHISFASDLDGEARQLRDEAIRRLAMGQDAPPELLLGVGGMNHWGAWLVREDVVSTHIEPPLALICDALTTQYLRPALESMNIPEAGEYVVWYDVSHMVMRPNRSTDAMALHEKGALSDEALRDASGFDDNDAPQALEDTDPAVAMTLDLVRADPMLAREPGIPLLLEHVRVLLGGESAAGDDSPVVVDDAEDEEETPVEDAPGALPETDVDTVPDDSPIAASAALNWKHVRRGYGGRALGLPVAVEGEK